ncbi:hypothetical protein EDB80DRAFT_655692 [Ilyonectria destructans]|nr:hypothetical protein EDB80DRAFT_655692 [Ilyonectria destructans]
MKLASGLLLYFLAHPCFSSIDSQSLLFQSSIIPQNTTIDPEELKARLNTTPTEYKFNERHAGMVYFCRDENWGPPCFVYYPELNYTCSELGPQLSGHVGSVFVEPGAICRLCYGDVAYPNGCAPFKFFAWPETQGGWANLFHMEVPGGDSGLGYTTTHFTCAKCTACIREV